MDQEFYVRRDCETCGRELYPRELFCVHCGSAVEEHQEAILLPSEGGGLSLMGAFFLDFFGMFLTLGVLFWSVPGLQLLLGTIVLTTVYRTLGRAQGRQTFGQAVFGLTTVGRDAAPVGWAQASRRTLGEFFWLPLLLVLGQRASRALERFSDSFEVSLV